MIISHKYKYLFLELPRTGSTSIARELTDHYDGQRIFTRHATYNVFLRHATREEQTYFVFSSIRNPLDRVVSEFIKIKNDHRGLYSNPEKRRMLGNALQRYHFLRMFNFVKETNADFESFFLKFYRLPYDDRSQVGRDRLDYMIRFERIQEDFAHVLKTLGIDQVRPLPHLNPTKEKQRDFLSYYTPKIIERAKSVFGPFMIKWGYGFPGEWGEINPSGFARAELAAVNILRKIIWMVEPAPPSRKRTT